MSKPEYAIQEIVILIADESSKSKRKRIKSLVAVGTGLSIAHVNGDSTDGYRIIHTATGYRLPDMEIAQTMRIAKLWLERVIPLFDWNTSIHEFSEMVAHRYGSSSALKDLICDALDEACRQARREEEMPLDRNDN